MNVAVIVPYNGKSTYQLAYDAIIAAAERAGNRILSPEKGRDYHAALAQEQTHCSDDIGRAHYEFMRKSIIDSDAVIVEASYEDFRIGHETTLALLYRKPVLAVSQTMDLGQYIQHPGFYAVRYGGHEDLPAIVNTFLGGVKLQYTAATSQRPPRAASTRWADPRQRTTTIAVCGGVYADIFNRVSHIPGQNEVALSKAFKISLGGKATNAAVAMVRMGARVHLCGRIGHDSIGTELESVLIHEGIKTTFLPRDPRATTGTVSLAVNDSTQYSTIVHEAANILITKDAVDKLFQEVDQGRLHLDCLYLTLEPQAEMVKYIIEEAARRQVFVFCDAAPHARPLDLKLLPLIDIVAPNATEATVMTNIPVHDISSAKKAAEFLAVHGARRVLITLGSKGACYLENGHFSTMDALPVTPIDEAGAGDAFRAAYVLAIVQGKPVSDALEAGRAAGAYAVTHFGSYDSMPTSEQLQATLAARRTL